jgi:anaerobic selenocysteine-containing dehydrogenase
MVDGVVRGNYAETCQRACISLYWWGTALQTGNVVELNHVVNEIGTGISLGGSNSEDGTKYGNIVRHNIIRAQQPMYLKGNRTPAPDLWAVSATGNYAPGGSRIGAASTVCPRVYVFGNESAAGGRSVSIY